MKKISKLLLIVFAVLLAFGVGFYAYNVYTKDTHSDHILSSNKSDKDKVSTYKKPFPSDENTNQSVMKETTPDTADTLLKDDAHVVAIGDSLTEGIGDSTKSGGYIGILEKITEDAGGEAKFDNFGHAGDRTDQLQKRMNRKNIKKSLKDADIILITIGANDIMKVMRDNIVDLNYEDFTKEQVHYEKRLNEIFTSLRELNKQADIYLIGFYNPFDKYFQDIPELERIVNHWNKAGENITKERKSVYYIPTKDIFDKTSEQLFYEDNFHPNDKGYQKIAIRVFETITK